ncbi:MAG: CoA-binding protein [Nitrososphaerales archaeon]
MSQMERIFNPKSIALIGACEKEGSVRRKLAENLLLGKDCRAVYAVNPNRKNVLALDCFPNVSKIPEEIDLAVIATPSVTVPQIVSECGEAGVAGLLIVSASFPEIGEEGRKLEAQIEETRKKYGMRWIGPNCVGFIRPQLNLNASFLGGNPNPGPIAFISQNGAPSAAILDWAVSSNIGFGLFISSGSMLDVDYGDLIDYLGEEDQSVKSIPGLHGEYRQRKEVHERGGVSQRRNQSSF